VAGYKTIDGFNISTVLPASVASYYGYIWVWTAYAIVCSTTTGFSQRSYAYDHHTSAGSPALVEDMWWFADCRSAVCTHLVFYICLNGVFTVSFGLVVTPNTAFLVTLITVLARIFTPGVLR
jgi:hypothetical protein